MGNNLAPARNIVASLHLNERQAIFVRKMAITGDLKNSSLAAGYSEAEGYRQVRNPRIVAGIESEIRRLLVTEGAPLAYRVAIDMIRKEETGAPTRAALVKIILDRAGFAPPTRSDGDQATKQLADMSSDELRGFIDKHESEIQKVEGELAARATPVNAPNVEAMPDKANDYLD